MPSTSILIGRPHYGQPGEVHGEQKNPLGMERSDERGNVYVYLKGVASTVNGSWVTYDDSHTTTLATSNGQGRVAVALAAVDSTSEYGWYQVSGYVDALCLANFADNGHVYLTSTAGSVDDAVTDDFVIGAIGRTARDTSTGMATFELNRPFVQNSGVATVSALSNSVVTLTSPLISGVAAASTGLVQVSGGVITELTGDGTYSVSVTLPAGALLLDLIITAKAVWTAGTSATLIVGDSDDPDGFFTAIDAKSVPAVGTSLRADTVPGGTGDGAYLGNTNAEFVGPAVSNFGRYYEAGSVITATVTKSGSGTGGRTHFAVVWAMPTVVAQVVGA